MNEQLSHTQSENSELKQRLSEEQSKCMKLQTEHSNLQAKLWDEQCLRKERETELSEFKKQTYNMVDKEVEHNRCLEKLHLQEVNELKNDIKRLKMESSNCKATELQHDNVPGCAIGTTLHTSSRKSNDSTKGKNNPSKIVKDAGCRKCGSIVSHQPSQCPAKNFVCAKCSKRGHHTFNCMHICQGCGGRRILCYNPANWMYCKRHELCILQCSEASSACLLTKAI